MSEKRPDGVDAWVKFGQVAAGHGRQYDDADVADLPRYPANRFRLRIVRQLLADLAPQRVLDVGCGSGEPLLAMLQDGHDAVGFDRAPEMVAEARTTLQEGGFEAGRVREGDMESAAGVADYRWDSGHGGLFDCVTALGVVYYARDFARAMTNVSAALAPGGHFIFSLRNDLFSLFSMNRYTVSLLLREMIPRGRLSPETLAQLQSRLGETFGGEDVARAFETVDDLGIHSTYHNPLTVAQDVLAPHGLSLEGTYFYHFHALPPVFEHTATREFRQQSAAMENPTDWRGHFQASAFVVHARKPA